MKYAVLILLVMCLVSAAAYAEAPPETELDISALETAGGEIEFGKIAEKFISGEGLDPLAFLKNILMLLTQNLRDNVSILLKIILLALCVCMLQSVSAQKGGKTADTAFFVCYMSVFIMCMKSIIQCAEIAREAIGSMDFFIRAAVPVLGGLMASAGGVARVAAVSASLVGASVAVSTIGSVILPLTKIAAVLCGVGNMCEGMRLQSMTEAVKKTVLWSFGVLMLIFTAFVGTHGLAASGADTIAIKAAKFAAGNFLPVVGSTVSDTMDSLITSARAVKGAVGAAGIIALIYICVTPALKLAAIAIAYRLASVIISPFADARLCAVLDGFASSVTVMMALVIGSALIFTVCTGVVCAM